MGSFAIYWALSLKNRKEKILNQQGKLRHLKLEVHIGTTVFALILWGDSSIPIQPVRDQNEGL